MEILLRAVKILLRAVEVLLQTFKIFMLNGRDFHDEWSRFSCWTIEIFMMNGRDFHDERSRFSCWLKKRDFHVEQSRFSCWHVEIFMLTGRDFHDQRSRFSWTVEIFMMTGRDFHDERSRILNNINRSKYIFGKYQDDKYYFQLYIRTYFPKSIFKVIFIYKKLDKNVSNHWNYNGWYLQVLKSNKILITKVLEDVPKRFTTITIVLII